MDSGISTSDLSAEALGMGSPRAEYRATTKQAITSGVVFVVFGVAAVAIGFLADSTGALIAMGAMGLLFLGAGIYQFVLGIGNRDMRIVVLDTGLVRVKGGKSEILRWDDITAFYQKVTDHYRNGMKTGTSHEYTVILPDGGKRVYNDVIQNVSGLGATLQQEATVRLLPKSADALAAGKTLAFKNLMLTEAGIGTAKQVIPWAQIDSVTLNRGIITVKSQGKTIATQMAGDTPNLLVFMTLVERLRVAG